MRRAARSLPAPEALLAVLAAVMMVAVTPPAFGARVSTARRFKQAEARFRSLTESPTARRRPELWDQSAARFRAIVSANPSGDWADDASYLLAEVYHERFHTFRRDADLDRAIEQYERLVDRYPQSPYADDALVQLGEIHYYQLGDSDQALRFYRRALRDYPDGDATVSARVRVAAIERPKVPGPGIPSPEVPSAARADSDNARADSESARADSDSARTDSKNARAGTVQWRPLPRATVDTNEATVGERPLPRRPLLSSPGAVIGGRKGGRVPSELLPKTLAPEEPEASRAGDGGGETTTPQPPARADMNAPSPAPEETDAPEPAEPTGATPVPLESGSAVPRPAPSRPLNPLLEEGPIPLRTPADKLPVLAPEGPRSQIDQKVRADSGDTRADCLKDS